VRAGSVVVSEVAAADIVEQSDWYESQSQRSLAERWERAVTSAVLGIIENPGSGTPCVFASSELRDLRRTIVTGFPKHLIFYRFSQGKIHVLRVVHGARDLERLLS
jgi:toxin ParE1/3/4